MIDPLTTRIISAKSSILGITPSEFMSPYILDIRIRHAGLRGEETTDQIESIVSALEEEAINSIKEGDSNE